MTQFALASGSNSNLVFAESMTGADVSGTIDNPSALMIRPTFSSTTSGYLASYAYKITAITTDKLGLRINLATPVLKWDGGCSGSSSAAGSGTKTLAECNAACHALSTCQVIVHRADNNNCKLMIGSVFTELTYYTSFKPTYTSVLVN